MTYLWIVFIFMHMVSVAFGLAVLWRLYYYIRRYRFDESKYTLLFGFAHLHWISGIYCISVIAWIAASYMIFTLL